MPDQIDLSRMDTIPVGGPYGFPRLERHSTPPTSDFWDELWKRTDQQSYWARAREGKALSPYRDLYLAHLNKGDRILEAGCGIGQVVISLIALGFDCSGLDFAEKTISMLKSIHPETPFYVGDIRALPFNSESFDAYISLGVIEHFQDGQLEFLKEASRILRPGGRAFVSVPFYNGYRKFRTRLGLWESKSTRPFFESCITIEELNYLMSESGFDFVEAAYTNPVMTFAQETPIRPAYRLIEDVRYVRGGIDRMLDLFLSDQYFGHMVMAVGKKR